MENILKNLDMKLKIGGSLPVNKVYDVINYMQSRFHMPGNSHYNKSCEFIINSLLCDFTNESIKLFNDYVNEEKRLNEAKILKYNNLRERKLKPHI